MCGKYTELHDAYKSIIESFIHAGVENNTKVEVIWVNTEKIKNDNRQRKHFKELMEF
jgi:CTP synthase